MKLSSDDVAHVATLAKLKLSDNELERFREQLSDVLSYISELESVDTSKVDPTSQTTGLTDIVRKDEIKPQDVLTLEEALSGANRKHNNYFLVDFVFDKNE